jgi:hypothetical protein
VMEFDGGDRHDDRPLGSGFSPVSAWRSRK